MKKEEDSKKLWVDTIRGNRVQARLQPVIKKMSKPLGDVTANLVQARIELNTTHNSLIHDMMNCQAIDKVRECIENVMKWNDIEDQILRQRENIEWLKKGMGIIPFSMPLLDARIQQKRYNYALQG